MSTAYAQSKGNEVNIPQAGLGTVWQHKRPQRRQREPLEELSFLFNNFPALKLDCPELGRESWKSTINCEVSGASATALENLSERLAAAQVVPITASGLQGV